MKTKKNRAFNEDAGLAGEKHWKERCRDITGVTTVSLKKKKNLIHSWCFFFLLLPDEE